ncbi:MAG: PG0541 family transporter-associated protein [Phycisphaerae bacterium]
MKLVIICYNEAIDNEVIEFLEQAGVTGYTKWTKVQGKGKTSGPHLITAIWPKANNALFTVLPEENADEIFERLRQLKTKVAKEGLKAFMWEIDDVT